MVAQAGTAISGVPEEAQRKYSAQSRIALLSRRELVVLDKVAAGKTNKIIAQELGLSVRTIENHRANILRKVGAQNSPELVRIAMEARIHPENE